MVSEFHRTALSERPGKMEQVAQVAQMAQAIMQEMGQLRENMVLRPEVERMKTTLDAQAARKGRRGIKGGTAGDESISGAGGRGGAENNFQNYTSATQSGIKTVMESQLSERSLMMDARMQEWHGSAEALQASVVREGTGATPGTAGE